MPFTPLHMGPGLAIKALAGHRFSLISFGIAQVAMDIEPLVGMLRGSPVLHGPTHTYLAALFIALMVAFVAPSLCRPILRRWNHELSYYHLDWLASPDTESAAPIVAGAFAGTMTHVALDTIMHADVMPFAPWYLSNGMLGFVPLDTLHQFCMASGIVGILVWLGTGWLRKRRLTQEQR